MLDFPNSYNKKYLSKGYLNNTNFQDSSSTLEIQMPGDTLGSKQYFKINASDSYYKKGNTYIIEILFSIQNFDF